MIAKRAERERAIALRKLGLSYSEIQTEVPVSQASLSLWLRGVELAPVHRQRLAERKLVGQLQGAQLIRKEKLARVAKTLSTAHKEAFQFLHAGELPWVIGTALYWAEGTKVKEWPCRERVVFTDMDSDMIRLVRTWLIRYCAVAADDLEYDLYIHPDADVEAAQRYWVRSLGVPSTRLHTYFKRHNPSPRRKHVGRTYYGTMRLRVRRSTLLAHRISGWIRAVASHCGVV